MESNDNSNHTEEGIQKKAFDFVKNLAPGSDLTKTSIPAIFSWPQSNLQVLTANWMTNSHVMMETAKCKSKLDRFLKMLEYNLDVYFVYSNPKKPFNPVLGEVYEASTDAVEFLAEQVSHHPPSLAFKLQSRSQDFSVTGFNTQRSHFAGKHIKVEFDQKVWLHYNKKNETYILSECPSAYFRIFRWAMEFNGDLVLECPESHLRAKVHFKSKPLIGGSWNAIEGTIARQIGREWHDEYQIQGHWDSRVEVIDIRSQKIYAHWDRTKLAPTNFQVNDSHPLSSTKVWSSVIDPLNNKDYGKAGVEKEKVEEEQRQKQRQLEANNMRHEPQYFTLDREGNWIPKGSSSM